MGTMRDAMLFSMVALTGLGGVLGCSARPEPDHRGALVMPNPTIEQVLEAHSAEWMSLPGVVGMGIGEFEGRPCIKVFLAGRAPGLAEKLPSAVEGYRVILEVTGQIRAFDPE